MKTLYFSNICTILIDLLQITKNLVTLPLYKILQICGAFPHVILKDVVLTCGFHCMDQHMIRLI